MLYADRSLKDEQLLLDKFLRKIKCKRGGRLKFKINILLYSDNPWAVTLRQKIFVQINTVLQTHYQKNRLRSRKGWRDIFWKRFDGTGFIIPKFSFFKDSKAQQIQVSRLQTATALLENLSIIYITAHNQNFNLGIYFSQ
jgi:hypothetical protein